MVHEPKIVDIDRLRDDVIIYFDDGECVLYPGSVLLSVREQAIRLNAMKEPNDWSCYSHEQEP